MNGKQLIKALSYLFKWSYFLNLTLGLGISAFSLINFIRPVKVLSANYLGKFEVFSTSTQSISNLPWHNNIFYFDRISGNPALVLNSNWHGFFIFLFVSTIVTITIVYNYQLWRLFYYLNNAAVNSSAFSNEVYHRLLFISKFSFIVFSIGLTGSICKLIFMPTFYLNSMVIKPGFDNQVLNFLWVGICSYIVAQVYNVGLELKKEQDLTI